MNKRGIKKSVTFCERVTAHPCPTDDESDNKEQVQEESLMHAVRGEDSNQQESKSLEEDDDTDYYAIALLGAGVALLGFGAYAYRRWKS